MSLEIRELGPGDQAVLGRVADGVFDGALDSALAAEFLADPRHHLVVASDDGLVVGFARGVDYMHPDKPPELFISEVAVAATHQRMGLGRALVTSLIEIGRRMGCHEAWVLTEPGNRAARALYAAAGGEESPEASIMFSFRL